MKRRNFLGMLRLAPLLAATTKLVPQKFWAGTTIPRGMPLATDAWKEIAESEARVQAVSGVCEIEIIDFPEVGKGANIVARGTINRAMAVQLGLTMCPDGVIRLSDLLWKNLSLKDRQGTANAFHCSLVDPPEPMNA